MKTHCEVLLRGSMFAVALVFFDLAACSENPVEATEETPGAPVDVSGTYIGKLEERADGTNITAELMLTQHDQIVIGSGWWHVWRRNGIGLSGRVDSLALAQSAAIVQGTVVDDQVSLLISLGWGTGNFFGRLTDDGIVGCINGHDMYHLRVEDGLTFKAESR